VASRFFVGNGTNWNSTGSWSTSSGGASGASVPGSADDVFFDANSPGNCTITASTSFGTLDCTGFTHTLTHNSAVTLTVSGNTFKLVPGMTYTAVNATTSAIAFTASTGTIAITTAGKTLSNVTLASGLTSSSATYQLQDALKLNSSALLTHNAGTFDTNNKALDIGRFGSNNTNVRTILFGSSVITISGGGTTVNWALTNTTNLTLNAGTSSITLTGTYTGGGGGFNSGGGGGAAGGVAYYDVAFSHTGTVLLSGSNSYHSLTLSPNAVVKVRAGDTQTATTFAATGTAGNLVTLSSDTAASAFSLVVAAGQMSCDYLSLQDCAAKGGAQFFAGAHSTDVSGNTGWRFTAPDRTAGAGAMLAAA
jgi:hypothetical protein